jgi:hypothetical protein
MQWHVELTREQFPRVAMHVEWAVMAQHAAIVARPARSIGRLPAPVAIALAALGVVLGIALRPSEPTLGTSLAVGFGCVLAAWAVVLVRRRQPSTRAGDRIRQDVARVLAPIERDLPFTLDYDLHDGRLDARSSRRGRTPSQLTAARAVVAVDVVALFRRTSSLLPWRVIQAPPRELIDVLRRHADVLEVSDAPAGYAEPLPIARQL